MRASGPESAVSRCRVGPCGSPAAAIATPAELRQAPGTVGRRPLGCRLAPTRHATDEFNANMNAAMPNTVWATGCTSWYLDADGTPELWPWTLNAYRQRLGQAPDPGDYELHTTLKGTRTR